jgi:GNAT superfamily N-acetyltransferase
MTASASIAFRTPDGAVRELVAEDGPRLQAAFEADPAFFELTHGLPPGPAEAQSTFVALPEGVDYSSKALLGLFSEHPPDLIAALDAIADYPQSGTWTIGLLFVAPRFRGRGIGHRLLAGFESWVGGRGADRVRLAVAEGNDSAFTFFQRDGFRVTGMHDDQSRMKALRVLEKPLTEGDAQARPG